MPTSNTRKMEQSPPSGVEFEHHVGLPNFHAGPRSRQISIRKLSSCYESTYRSLELKHFKFRVRTVVLQTRHHTLLREDEKACMEEAYASLRTLAVFEFKPRYGSNFSKGIG